MRCKMTLQSITRTKTSVWRDGKSEPVVLVSPKFTAVHGNSGPENAEFFAMTPQGELSLGVVNESAVAGLELGKSYFIDITEAPAN